MALEPSVYIVCSDQHRNGKTLLARVLVDYLMIEGRDPFVIDAGYPEGLLRSHFPGRTALVNFSTVRGQMKVFDTILGSPGRDYVIDLTADETQRFFEVTKELGFFPEARRSGFRLAILFVIDQDQASLETATKIDEAMKPDLLVPVRNLAVGSALPESFDGLSITMPLLPTELAGIIAGKRFSFRNFLLGDEGGVPLKLRQILKNFLQEIASSLREIGPALSLSRIRF